jgi:enamine deaminase RidA (YjgF/YER057c/UK114 family)
MSSTHNSPQARLAALGLTLPPVGPPAGAYKPCLVIGRQAFVSGHLPVLPDGTRLRGRVGQDLDVAAGKEAARLAGLAILATLVASLGSLDAVGRVIKVLGLVNCTPDFEQHPQVINGCSELFAEIWGQDHGIGVRSAVGAASLPAGVPVEVEAVFELA